MAQLLLVAPFATLYLFFLLRISAFRVDRPWHRGYFGPPITGFGFEPFNRAAYSAQGQKYFRWLIGSAMAVVLSMLAAFAWLSAS
jgi:hypothetical protein